jgi:predicted Fe-S protein YdhL (DUF1289 family)
MKHLTLALAIVVLLFSCARGEVTRADWQAMSPEEKTLIIESFRGHEAARDAKGGDGRLHPQSNDEYRERIDAIYDAGDERTVAEIWDGLVEEKTPGSVTE